jgi:hypothetical protein
MRIPPGEIEPHPHSFVDDGRVFWWRDDLYRALPAGSLGGRLLDEGVLAELSEQGILAGTEATDLELDGYERVVRHRAVPFVSYPNEWCSPMFRDAVIALLDLSVALAPHGLVLKDAHPWNIVFDGSMPLWVDVGSIVEDRDGSWLAAEEFVRFCLNPLLLMGGGHGALARLLLPEHAGVTGAELRIARRSFVRDRRAVQLAAQARRARPGDLAGRVSFFRTLRERIEAIDVPWVATQAQLDTLADPLARALEALQPRSAVVVESPSAAWALARRGVPVVALDRDESATASLYATVRRARSPLLPLVMDVTLPTPSRGIAEHWQIAAASRLACEIVLAPGVVGRLGLDYGLPPAHVLRGLAAFATSAIVVDVDLSEAARAAAGLVETARHGPLAVLERH